MKMKIFLLSRGERGEGIIPISAHGTYFQAVEASEVEGIKWTPDKMVVGDRVFDTWHAKKETENVVEQLWIYKIDVKR